jgi:hypothetical protein
LNLSAEEFEADLTRSQFVNEERLSFNQTTGQRTMLLLLLIASKARVSWVDLKKREREKVGCGLGTDLRVH